MLIGVTSQNFASPFFGIIWEPETLLITGEFSNSLENAPLQSKMVATPDGQLHLVWMSDRAGTPQRPQIYYKRFVPDVGWTPDTCISADLAQWERCGYPAIACDSQGNIHIVWAQYDGYHIWYKMRRADGVWDSVSTLISVGSGTMPRFDANIACTPDGSVHVVWREWYPIYGSWVVYREKKGGVWSPTFTVDSVDTTHYIVLPQIAAGPDNRVHTVHPVTRWSSPDCRYFYRYRTDTVWSPLESIPCPDTVRWVSFSVLAINAITGEPNVSADPFQGSLYRVFHTFRSFSGWQNWMMVSLLDTFNHSGASLFFINDGTAYAVWRAWKQQGPEYTVGLWLNQRTVSGEWQTPSQVAPYTTDWQYFNYFLTGMRDSLNCHNLYLIWNHEDSSSHLMKDIYFKKGRSGPQGVSWSKGQVVAGWVSDPMFGAYRIGYFLERAGVVEIDLYDVSGRMVRILERGGKGRGKHFTVIPHGLPAGVYFVTLKMPDINEVKKVVLVR